VTLSNLAKIQ